MPTPYKLTPVYSGVVNQAGTESTITDSTGNYDANTNPTGYGTPNKATTANLVTEFIFTKPDGTSVTVTTNRVFTGLITASIPATAIIPIPYNALTLVLDTADLSLTPTEFPDGVYQVKARFWYTVAGAGTSGQNYVLIDGTTGLVGDQNGGSLSAWNTNAGFNDALYVRVYVKAGATVVTEDRTISSITDANHLVVEQAWTIGNFPTTTSVYVLAGYEVDFGIKVITSLLDCFQPKIAKISIEERTCCATCKSDNVTNLKDILFGLFVVDAQFESGLFEQANDNIETLGTICEADDCGCDC